MTNLLSKLYAYYIKKKKISRTNRYERVKIHW